MTDDARKTEETRKLEAAIAAQESLRGILPDEQLEAALAALRGQMAKLQQASAGQGNAVAQGPGATAVGSSGLNVPGMVYGGIYATSRPMIRPRCYVFAMRCGSKAAITFYFVR